MNRINEFLSEDLHSIKIDSTSYRVEAEASIANRNFKYSFDLSGHALSDPMCDFLVLRGSHWPASTLIGYCNAFVRLLEVCKNGSYEILNGETFGAYIDWLKNVKNVRTGTHFVEGTRRGYGNFVLKFMDWLAETGTISPREAHWARLRHRRAFRGSSARKLEVMRASAVPPDDFVRLIRAVRLEFEESTRVLERPSSEQSQYDPSFPLLPFSILLGSKLALRSVEFNYLSIRDLRGDRLILNPPGKESSEVWLTTELMTALNLARNWMSRYRPNPALDDPLLVIPIQKGPRSKTIVRFDTILFAQSVKKLYRKYFDLLDPDGMPYLFETSNDDESNLIPFSLSFMGFRSAALTDAARHERNPEAVMRFARHKSFDTTTKYYIHETHQQWLNNVALSLAPSAELLRISLENKIASPEEEKIAQATQAAVPGGHCEQALSGDRSCRRASDCRLCSFFRIHISKRELFVKERDDALDQAHYLQSDQGLTRDAQNLREFAALNQAIVSRIDDHLSDHRAKPL